MKPVATLLISVLGSLVVSNCGGRPPAAVSSSVPDACSIALAPAAERDRTDREITRLQQRARHGPDARQPLTKLGFQYVARARARNDAGDYALAQKTAECLTSKYPDDVDALLLKGHAIHQLHRFAEAEEIGRRLVSRRGLALDYGLLGDALMERGRLVEAGDAYQKMIDLKPFYQSYTRAAHLRWLRGDLSGAIELMRMAIAAASPRDPESLAWAYTRMAAYELQRARFDAAKSAVTAALQQQPDYAAALLVKGKLLLARQQQGEGLSALHRAVRLDPLPEYQWAFADALRLTGQPDQADAEERLLLSGGARVDPRTTALFLATRRIRLPEAIAWARAEMNTRQDVFTLDALAWSLAAAGRIDEAAPLMTRALAEGTQDARLLLHAAVISAATGHTADARRLAARAARFQSTLLPSELAELATVQTNTAATTREK